MTYQSEAQDIAILAYFRRVVAPRIPRDLQFRSYFSMLETPGVAEAYMMARGRLRDRRVSSGTQIVIEGFPASANTYSRQAFLLANPEVTRLTTHVHSARVVRHAARQGVPCILLVRDPREAVASLVQRFPGVTLETALRCYTRYHKDLVDVLENVVVAPFPEVVGDFSAVVRRCNERFGVDFAVSPAGRQTDDMVFSRIEANARARNGGRVPESKVARPSSRRVPAAELMATLGPAKRRLVDDAVAAWQGIVAAR